MRQLSKHHSTDLIFIMRYGQNKKIRYHPFYKAAPREVGIIYCLSRKKSGGIAQVLQVNG
jgi:superfamily II DNA helicase RecQ